MRRVALALLASLATTAEAADVTLRGEVNLPREDRSGVVVYVTGFEEPPPPTHVALHQCGGRMVPTALVTRVGQPVDFINDDRVVHNVFSPVGHLDMGRAHPHTTLTHTFDTPGPVDLFCDIHEFMRGAVVVVPNHAFAITGPDGRFEIHHIPAGTHPVFAWHAQGPLARHDVVFAAGADASVSFDLTDGATATHLDRSRRPYGAHPREYESDAGFADACPPDSAIANAVVSTSGVPDAGAGPVHVESDPVFERAQLLREAATQVEKAAAEKRRGNKALASRLFLSAEALVGPEALEGIAGLFQEGAPPRVNSPLKQLPLDSAAQPEVVGHSDADTPRLRPERAGLTGQLVLDGAPLADGRGVVTLEPLGAASRAPVARAAVMEQRGRQFAPHVLVVPKGSTVSFPNFDPIYHNVFSTSEAKAFDLGLYSHGQAREVVFDREGVVRLGCELHESMSAWVVVVTQPYYGVTDPSGRFRFRSLRPGRYVLHAWSEASAEPVVQEVRVVAGPNTVSVALTRKVGRSNPDKFGAPR